MLGPARRRNRVEVTLENLRSGSLDLRRAGLDLRRPVTLVVRSDAGTAVSLRGWPAGVVVTRVGRRVVDRSTVDRRTVVLDTTKGRRVYRLSLD